MHLKQASQRIKRRAMMQMRPRLKDATRKEKE
jgi:hypothetical protein